MSKNHIKVNSIAKHRTIVSRSLDELKIATEQLRRITQSTTCLDHIIAAEKTVRCARTKVALASRRLRDCLSRHASNPTRMDILAGNVAEVTAMACTDDDLVALSLGDDHAAMQARYRQWVESNDVDYDVAAGLLDEGVVLASVAKYARALREHLQERANKALTSS